MTVESAADRAAFLADFGMPITWQVGAGAPAAITALYDGGALPQDMQAGGVVNARGTLTMRAEDLPANAGAPTDTIIINTVTFHPKSLLPDATGMVVVTLEREI